MEICSGPCGIVKDNWIYFDMPFLVIFQFSKEPVHVHGILYISHKRAEKALPRLRFCAISNAQSRESSRCSHTQSRDEAEGSNKIFRPLAPLDSCTNTVKHV